MCKILHVSVHCVVLLEAVDFVVDWNLKGKRGNKQQAKEKVKKRKKHVWWEEEELKQTVTRKHKTGNR